MSMLIVSSRLFRAGRELVTPVAWFLDIRGIPISKAPSAVANHFKDALRVSAVSQATIHATISAIPHIRTLFKAWIIRLASHVLICDLYTQLASAHCTRSRRYSPRS